MDRPILAAMLSVEGKRLTDQEKYLLSKSNPLGITLFNRNIGSKIELKDLVKDIKATISRDDVLIAVDQEGGRIRRLAEPDFRSYASQSAIGSLDDFSASRASFLHAYLISQDLKEIGVNWNYAPCLDVSFSDTTIALKSRCFSNDEKKVAKLGKIMIEEYINQGICPCIKHMPGHGRAIVDPHLNLPHLDFSLKEMEKDFYPFQQVATIAPAGMTAHIVISEIDDQLPITQSKKCIDKLIRGIIGFDGLLISDAIDMHALKGSIGEKARLSLDAGCDVVCYCLGMANELEEVIKNTHIMTDKAMQRFSKIVSIIKKSNLELLEQDYNILTGKAERYNDNYDATEVLNKMKQR